MATPEPLDAFVSALNACRHCQNAGIIPEARPIFQISSRARVGLFSQAPGNLAHRGGRPFMDPSGIRLRAWLGVDEGTFYDPRNFAILPMAFCFPGYDGSGATGKGGDLPPPRVCAEMWRERALAQLTELEVILLIGGYAQEWHLGRARKATVTETVRSWKDFPRDPVTGARVYVLPHPSWRNTAWLRKNTWFENDVLPELREQIATALRDQR